MTDKMIDNRVKKLQDLEAKQAALEQEADAIRAELKAELEARRVDEVKTSHGTVRWKQILSQRFDCKSFKAQYSGLYDAFLVPSFSRRFTVA